MQNLKTLCAKGCMLLLRPGLILLNYKPPQGKSFRDYFWYFGIIHFNKFQTEKYHDASYLEWVYGRINIIRPGS
jgi:hypothetical protein